MSIQNKLARFLNAAHVLVLCSVLLSAYGVQFLIHEQPCPLCLLQRLAMIGIAISLICNLKFGICPLHYGLGILSSSFGTVVSLRQMALHICPQFPTFGEPILGLDLYWWAFIVFKVSILFFVLYLFLYNSSDEKKVKMNWFEKFVFGLTALLTLSNVVTAFIECGFGACAG
jgi:disulfide bond formation protein DsbB